MVLGANNLHFKYKIYPKASEASLGVSEQLVYCVTLLLQDGLAYQPETFRVCSGHASPGLVKISDGSDDQDQVGVSQVPLLGHGDEIDTPNWECRDCWT